MTRLESLCDAIKTYEGWYMFSRSWRNNNPGNLRWSKFQSGVSGGFASFHNFATGWLALWYDLWKKCNGQTSTGLNSEKTLYNLISVWAPAEDGNAVAPYAKFVAERVGCEINTKLGWFLEDLQK